jgi:hypothetical protein
MKSVKFMITGALLILLGPAMSLIDVCFSGFHMLCWFVGIPLFVVGLWMSADGRSQPEPNEDLPQKVCPRCGRQYLH